jgi:hypothetical protein
MENMDNLLLANAVRAIRVVSGICRYSEQTKRVRRFVV